MTRRTALVSGALGTAVPVLAMVAILVAHWAKQPRTHVSRWTRADLVTRIQGPSEVVAPFVLVEFADYRCPACRQADANIKRIVSQSRGRLSLLRLEYPLERPVREWDPCLVAEALDLQGRREPFDAAAEDTGADLTPTGVQTILTRMGQVSPRPTLSDGTPLPPCAPVDMSRLNANRSGSAMAIVRQDMALAQRLHIAAVPSFFLCGPDGVCYTVRSLRDIPAILGQTPPPLEG